MCVCGTKGALPLLNVNLLPESRSVKVSRTGNSLSTSTEKEGSEFYFLGCIDGVRLSETSLTRVGVRQPLLAI